MFRVFCRFSTHVQVSKTNDFRPGLQVAEAIASGIDGVDGSKHNLLSNSSIPNIRGIET